MSENILEIPLNPRGAIEMGISPCDGCDVGWASYSQSGINTCQDECRYWKEYMKMQRKNRIYKVTISKEFIEEGDTESEVEDAAIVDMRYHLDPSIHSSIKEYLDIKVRPLLRSEFEELERIMKK